MAAQRWHHVNHGNNRIDSNHGNQDNHDNEINHGNNITDGDEGKQYIHGKEWKLYHVNHVKYSSDLIPGNQGQAIQFWPCLSAYTGGYMGLATKSWP